MSPSWLPGPRVLVSRRSLTIRLGLVAYQGGRKRERPGVRVGGLGGFRPMSVVFAVRCRFEEQGRGWKERHPRTDLPPTQPDMACWFHLDIAKTTLPAPCDRSNNQGD